MQTWIENHVPWLTPLVLLLGAVLGACWCAWQELMNEEERMNAEVDAEKDETLGPEASWLRAMRSADSWPTNEEEPIEALMNRTQMGVAQ